MNVLMLSSEFYPVISGGLGIACYSLARNLLKLGIKVYLILPSKYLVYFQFKNIEDLDDMIPVFIRADEKLNYELRGFNNKYEKLSYLGLRLPLYDYPELILKDEDINQIVSHIKFDVIHANDWPTVRAALKIKEFSKKPMLLHIHSTEFERACGKGNTKIHSTESMGLHKADSIIAVSKRTRSIIVQYYGVSDSSINVVYNAHDPDTFPADISKGSIKAIKNPVVVFVGRLTLQKGPYYFLEIAKKIIKSNESFRFIIAGDGELRNELIQFIDKESLNFNISLTGFLSRGELSSLFNLADVLLLTSVSEPFGIAVLEAMSFGVLPLVSKESGIVELIKWLPSFNYWDIKGIADFTITLFKNQRMIKKFSKKAVKTAKRNTWDRRVKHIIKIYKNLISVCL